MTPYQKLQSFSTGRLCALIAVVYAAIAYTSLQIAFAGTNASPVWPPSGIAFTAVWFLGYRVWPGIWLGAFIANVMVFIHNNGWTPAQALPVSALIGIGNSAEALIGVFLLRSFAERTVLLSTIRDIFKFIFAALVACLSSATIGTSIVYFTHPAAGISFDMIWFTWWLGDVVGILVIASIFLTFQKKLWRINSLRQALEALLAGLVLIIVNAGVFMGKFPEYGFYSHVTYLVLPFAIWATYRFGFPGATLSILTTSIIAIFGSIFHLGPFVGQRVPEDLVIVQCFLGVIAVTVLTLAAALHERQKADEDIKYSEARFRSVVEFSPVAKVVVNKEGEIQLVNKTAETLFGYGRKELLNMKIESLVPEQFRGRHPAYRKGFHDDPKARPMGPERELYALRKDGTQVPVEIGLTPIETEEGLCVLASILDITQRKKAEEVLKRDKESLEQLVDKRSQELIKTQKELKQFSRLADIGTLAATVAHELRNPLGVIHLAAYNLKKEKSDLDANKHLVNIEKKVWEGNQIIDNLLSYARIKIPNYEQVHIRQILDECAASVQERFREKGIIIEKKYEDGLESIEADPNQIREIFLNILNNACQAFAKPGGKVKVKLEREGDQARVSVQDTGAGIAPEDLDHVFEPFFTRKSKGTGLGLTICNELVNLHQGRIEINSRLGQGTIVCVYLPVYRSSNETASH